MDRRSNGERIGPCPSCGGHKWWDNRAAKRAGQAKQLAPDFVCVGCRKGVWESDAAPSWEPAGTALPADSAPRNAGAGFRQCVAIKRDGSRCGGAAMDGSDRCGPHQTHGVSSSGRCHGVTKKGEPCRAGAVRGREFCPQHETTVDP